MEGARADPIPLFVSRSDSTLRGHYPVETDVMAEELGPFDAHFLIPAFFEGGRITRDCIHYLMVNGQPVPTRPNSPGIPSSAIHQLSAGLRCRKDPGPHPAPTRSSASSWPRSAGLRTRLLALHGNACGVVDAENQADLDRFAADVLASVAAGKRFLFRSAASLLTALARLPAQPVAPDAMRAYVRGGRPGAVIVGSHVKKTTDQLACLLQQAGVGAVEIDVDRIPTEGAALLTATLARAAELHDQGADGGDLTPAGSSVPSPIRPRVWPLATRSPPSSWRSCAACPADLGFLISKGGITSNDVLSSGLALARLPGPGPDPARLLRGALPGGSPPLPGPAGGHLPRQCRG